VNLATAQQVLNELLKRGIATNLRTVNAEPESEHTIEIPARDVAGVPLVDNVSLRRILDLADEHDLELAIEGGVVTLK
jgi:hypothetical protein